MKSEKDTNTFDPKKYLQTIQGNPYLPVKWRIYWMKQDHPDWNIRTRLVEFNSQGYSIFEAQIVDEKGEMITNAHGMASTKMHERFFERSETTAVGRALLNAGYGTEFTGEAEDGDSNAPAKPAAKAHVGSKSPECPKCGKTMRLKTNTKTGKDFWSCSDFPKCKGTMDSKTILDEGLEQQAPPPDEALPPEEVDEGEQIPF